MWTGFAAGGNVEFIQAVHCQEVVIVTESAVMTQPEPAAAVPEAPAPESKKVGIKTLLEEMVRFGASDLHLKCGSPPTMRINGVLRKSTLPPLHPEDTYSMTMEMMPSRFKEIPSIGALDFSYAIPGVARYRVNVFHQRGNLSIVIRKVNFEIPNFDELNLPPVVEKFAELERGIVLLTGVTGSGKSTTLAAMLNKINKTRNAHIVTIEDPIEFLYRDERCIINQMELGIDFETFEDAMKRVLRQDPDIILVGEMRDRTTIRAAITAAETGHLVFSTLHTADTAQTVERILKHFDTEEHELILQQLSNNLKGVISQRLMRRADGKGRVPGIEVLVATPVVQKLIYEGRLKDIKSAVQNREGGMQTFNQHLLELVMAETVTKEEALRYVDNIPAFERMLRGGTSSGDGAGLVG
jgi:twitching motility protein PilT